MDKRNKTHAIASAVKYRGEYGTHATSNVSPRARGKGAEVFFGMKTKVLLNLNGDPNFMGLFNKGDIYEDRIDCRT